MDTINGKPLSQFGATMLSGAYAELMTPAPLKSFLENKDRSKDGTDVLISNPRLDEKEVTLNFVIAGGSGVLKGTAGRWYVSIEKNEIPSS